MAKQLGFFCIRLVLSHTSSKCVCISFCCAFLFYPIFIFFLGGWDGGYGNVIDRVLVWIQNKLLIDQSTIIKGGNLMKKNVGADYSVFCELHQLWLTKGQIL